MDIPAPAQRYPVALLWSLRDLNPLSVSVCCWDCDSPGRAPEESGGIQTSPGRKGCGCFSEGDLCTPPCHSCLSLLWLSPSCTESGASRSEAHQMKTFLLNAYSDGLAFPSGLVSYTLFLIFNFKTRWLLKNSLYVADV